MKRLPRYTSYPTASHFHHGVSGKQYTTWIKLIGENDSLSLYFHIPYCKKLCWFCACHTKIINHYEPITKYMKLLEQEVKLVASSIKNTPVKHIHFGGGSPTILAAEGFVQFIKLLQKIFNIQEKAEIAVEMDPRTLNLTKITAYKKVGVTRASLGVQDFDPQVQKAINRVQSYKMVNNVVSDLRLHGINALNIDLIYGLPFQSIKTIKSTLKQTLLLDPDRISLFGYAHLPWMKKHQKLILEEALPNKEKRISILKYASTSLQDAGYVAVGLDHFAKPDDELAIAFKNSRLRRNFQGYTTDIASTLLGFGISSISSFPQGYTQNTSNNTEYKQLIEAGEFAIARGVALTKEDQQRRNIIMSLMCQMRSNIDEILYAKELKRLLPYIKSGDVCFENGTLVIFPSARNKLRLIASVFDNYS